MEKDRSLGIELPGVDQTQCAKSWFFLLFHCLKNQVSKRSMSHSRSFLCKYGSVDLIFAKRVLTGPSLAQRSTAALITAWPSSISNAAQLEKSSYFGSVETMLSRVTFIYC